MTVKRTRCCAWLVPIVLTGLFAIPGCARRQYFPDRATRPYPDQLHTIDTIDIQVFRDGTRLEVVNSTPNSYRDFDLWVNQRYVKHIDSLPAGETIRVSLREFYDRYGEVIDAGGFFRTVEATPVRLVEIQRGEDQPLVGLITIPRAEEDEITSTARRR